MRCLNLISGGSAFSGSKKWGDLHKSSMVAPNVVMSICVYTRDSILTAPDGIYTRFLFLSFGNYTNQIYPISISTIPYQHLGSCLRWIPLGEPKIIVWVHKEKQNKGHLLPWGLLISCH
ncbi:hypothetical protein ES319_A13G028000v1 [Gossypium barbadense]|uniref:Uncharacterized protein n=1 Tax=Gossypium barbadense TaxID=3634 RepID=A0A5J5SX81_GOSBA|nr:hypothetical protein ES319_A13G028000v1 [Gossypium barbadense]